MSNLRRRAAFWRNLEYDLDQMIYGNKTRLVEKWIDDSDKESIERVNDFLEDALACTRQQYVCVLKAQINEINGWYSRTGGNIAVDDRTAES